MKGSDITSANTNYTVARIETRSRASVGKFERHIERKNESYENMNVDLTQSKNNIHFKSCGDKTYNEYLDTLIEEGKVSLRGLKPDATVFDEMILDVNSEYFYRKGGYRYARMFYEAAFHFAEKIYGKENIISAVMHADELNVAMSERFGEPVYHYHLHIVALPVVDKEIRWSKRCKDKELIGTVKEVIHQVSHSKKWKSAKVVDENGKEVLNSKGKPMYHSSYSILQDKFYDFMRNAGYTGFERGERGSTAENLSVLDYKIQKDQSRLKEIESRIKTEVIYQESKQRYSMTESEIEKAGKKSITGKYTMDADKYEKITALAHDGNTLRGEVLSLRRENRKLRERIGFMESRIRMLERQLEDIEEKCADFLTALKIAPRKILLFIEDIIKKFKEQENSIFYERQSEERNRYKSRGHDR